MSNKPFSLVTLLVVITSGFLLLSCIQPMKRLKRNIFQSSQGGGGGGGVVENTKSRRPSESAVHEEQSPKICSSSRNYTKKTRKSNKKFEFGNSTLFFLLRNYFIINFISARPQTPFCVSVGVCAMS